MGAFDKMMKQLEKLNGKAVSMPLEADDAGYLDRQCPNPDCQFLFKVLLTDWQSIFKQEQVFCPMCRHESAADNWFTTEQAEQILSQLGKYIRGYIANALQSAATEANRKWPSDSWLKMTISVKGETSKHIFVPIAAQEAFTLKVECSQCKAHYAVIGSAFFCPNCGHNSAEQTFDDALRKVGAKLDYTTLVRNATRNANQLDEGELVARSLVETTLSDCVSALQRLCEELFKRHFPHEAAPFNVFQRIDESSALWRRKLGVGYDNWLSDAQLQEMKMLYQRRHLLAHSEGMVDDKYLQKSQDNSYKAGQRIVVKEKDVRTLIDYVSTIASGLKGALTSA